jgi:AcrR family transcriptional regulator
VADWVYNKEVNKTVTSSLKRDQREAEILDTALDVFADLGFKKASVDEIALRLSLSPGALYRYAADKRDLYKKAVARGFGLWQDEVRKAVAGMIDPVERFRTACRSAFSYLSRDARLRRVLARDPGLFPFFEAEDPFSDINRSSRELMEGIIRDGVAKGAFCAKDEADIQSASRVIFSLYVLFVQKAYVAQEAEEAALFERGLDLILDGLRVR